jgi:hypothetical protein
MADDGCLPACLEDPVKACLSTVTDCEIWDTGPNGETLCWADGVRWDQPPALKLDDGYAIYKPDGSVCLEVSNDGPNSFYQDGQGQVFAQITADSTSPTGMSITCGTTKYVLPASPLPAACMDRMLALNPRSQTGTCSTDAGVADGGPPYCAQM